MREPLHEGRSENKAEKATKNMGLCETLTQMKKKTPHMTQQRAKVTLQTQMGAQRHQK